MPRLSQTELVLEASSIADRLVPPLLDSLGPHLYHGVTGVALFLAAMARVTGGEGYRTLCLRELKPVRRRLQRLVDDPAARCKIRFKLGGLIGLGGHIYALARIGELLDEPELIDTAQQVASLITPDLIDSDEALDVAHGCAGAILALLVLDRTAPPAGRPGGREVDRAHACGEHLLRSRIDHGGHKAWRCENNESPLCGFAHGAAGIAYALVKLYVRTGEAAFREAAYDGTAFERDHYDPAHKNWLDLRGIQGLRFMNSWCHGAPGIALSRLAMRAMLGAHDFDGEIRDALETTLSGRGTHQDSLCCGTIGHAEILLCAYEILGDSTLLDGAHTLAAKILARRPSDEGLPGDHEALWRDPSLFRGAAGLGYVLLRLADRSLLTSPLLLD